MRSGGALKSAIGLRGAILTHLLISIYFGLDLEMKDTAHPDILMCTPLVSAKNLVRFWHE